VCQNQKAEGAAPVANPGGKVIGKVI